MGITGSVGKRLAPRISKAAPDLTNGFVREALERAIRGVGPLPGAATIAQRQLDEHNGDVDLAIRDIIEMHVRYAGAQGFLTNIGGLITANLSSIAFALSYDPSASSVSSSRVSFVTASLIFA